MSEPIPESIPTSHDPRSKRPTKKRALSPKSQRASEVEALFAKPDQTIALSQSSALTPAGPNGTHVPEIVQNVQGSSAGAGSGEFHVYKASRRREYERVRGMEEEVRNEEEGEKWERERKEREERDREVTRRKREKRERSKKKGGKGKGGSEGQVEREKVKPRVELKPRTGDDAEEGPDNGGAEVQEVGIVIHDDD